MQISGEQFFLYLNTLPIAGEYMKPRWDTITTIALFGRNFPSVKKGFRTPLGIIESQVYPANENKNAQLNLIISFYHRGLHNETPLLHIIE